MSERFREEPKSTFKKNFQAEVGAELAKVPDEKLFFGPRYVIATASGEMQVDTVSTFCHKAAGSEEIPHEEYLKEIADPFQREQYRENCFLLASLENNGLVGFRKCSLAFERRTPPLRSKQPPTEALVTIRAYIEIAEKGKGLAMPLELAFSEFLQQAANEHGVPVEWRVFNANLQHLNSVRAKIRAEQYREHRRTGSQTPFIDDFDVDDDPRIVSLLEEQKRWLALYGTNGKLGVTMEDELSGVKVFQPTASRQTSRFSEGVIHLSRFVEGGKKSRERTSVEAVSELTPAQQQKFHKEQLQFLKSITS